MPTLKKICQIVNGKPKGNQDVQIIAVNSIYKAREKEITFAAVENINLDKVKAAALLVKENSQLDYPNLIYVENPYLAFATLLDYFYPHQRFNQNRDTHAFIADTAVLGPDVSVGAFSYIGKGCRIGDQTEIHSGVKIYEKAKIGKNCLIYSNVVIGRDVEIGDHTIIHPGAVIGADGFGFHRTKDGIPVKIPQKGRVKIGNYCEIGANTTIDRSTIETTELQDHVKVDNLVQIGHNVKIGHSTTISALTGISGSVEIGKQVIMGGQVGIADHIQITDGVIIAAKTGITGNIKERGIIAGIPHQPISKWRKNHVIFRNLDSYIDRIKDLEKKIKKLEDK